ncbi:hypothetical protein RclHR1_15120001 [Rhizophagus clarus]|uniref:Uncharacterized protein n=1 Tax=Rhizophagus clarus TaxID=94130 RepID=A0A2Z6QEF5_9GLOM|nr:hypothetical protein RclHR1_15120001 [Rhizophagus clarus]
MYILIENDISKPSENSNNNSADDELPITASSSSTAANKFKLVVTPQAPEEEIDISFTKEDQSANELLITNEDQPKMDSDPTNSIFFIIDPLPLPLVLEKLTLIPSSTQEKGKSLGRKDKKLDIYGEDEANYIVTGFQSSPTSKAV